MPSSWNVYYVIFLSAALALGIPVFLTGVSYLVAPRKARSQAQAQVQTDPQASPEPSLSRGSVLGKRINARFFLGVNAALVLIALALALLPCAGMLQPAAGTVAILHGLIAIVTIGCFASLGLFYSVRKGDLKWLDSFRRPTQP